MCRCLCTCAHKGERSTSVLLPSKCPPAFWMKQGLSPGPGIKQARLAGQWVLGICLFLSPQSARILSMCHHVLGVQLGSSWLHGKYVIDWVIVSIDKKPILGKPSVEWSNHGMYCLVILKYIQWGQSMYDNITKPQGPARNRKMMATHCANCHGFCRNIHMHCALVTAVTSGKRNVTKGI